jgi:hypothetical protein
LPFVEPWYSFWLDWVVGGASFMVGLSLETAFICFWFNNRSVINLMVLRTGLSALDFAGKQLS